MAVVRIEGLPAIAELEQEGYTFSEKTEGALKVAVMNLMPLKEQTERQLLRRMAVAESLVDVTFLTTETYRSTHVDPAHLEQFYTTFSKIRHEKWDGLIITGAPVENMEFEEAAKYRDLLNSVKQVSQKQKITDSVGEDKDVIALYQDEAEAVVQVFFMLSDEFCGID